LTAQECQTCSTNLTVGKKLKTKHEYLHVHAVIIKSIYKPKDDSDMGLSANG